ncbi:hypothetical protein V2J09_013588 [Rumex salicifolius]
MSAALIPPWLLNLVVVVNGGIFLLLLLPTSVESQNTDPAEAKAFNTIFKNWGITSNIAWNTSDDPCSGSAVQDSISIEDTSHDPFIKCDCTFNNNSTCRITALKVYSLDAKGQIPDELWTLTYLTNLNLAQNYLTGSISPSIGNLTKMQYLTFGINALSGNLPKEIGKLTQLKSLALSTNNFSGPLPSELGNIDGLEQLYLDSSGFSGEIPPSFSKLVNLQKVWMSDVEFNGSIPEFIGNWTQLIDLRLEGNSFAGSIPSSFSNLTALQTLRIGDLSNGTSSLAFITNLTSLNTLVLRDIDFSDSIPTDIGGLAKLNYLDLSFNKISGKIPDSLFSLGSLQYLFLGNNKLTGTLPSNKSSSLTNIDVSYNQLSGTIPTWISSTIQLNLVANNFTGISNSALPSGSKCLQNDFPCYLGNPKYSSFAVKCGGPQIKASDGTENESLGPATYYVADTERWGVSNAGHFLANNNVSFFASTSSQFSNTLDSELFQTARLSPGSLRYYGLGLENGNYTVTLQFAELTIQNGNTWKSLGRRVFDVYIQGNLALKNFDIRKAAGGVSYSVVKDTFNATVTSNHLEIHLLWAGKGTCCVPAQGTYGPSISAISITPNFVPTVTNKPPSNNTHLILAIVLPVACLCLLLIAVCYVIVKRRRLRAAQDEELLGGKLSDGRDVAVKQLAFKSRQGKRQFVAEIVTISSVKHRNLVKLHGCCIEGENRLLVYEYMTWQLYESKRELDLIDEKLEGMFNEEEVKKVIRIGLLCTQTAHTQRPSMSRVVAMLAGDVEVGNVPAKPGYLADWRYDDASFLSTTVSSYNGAYTTTSSATTTMSPNAQVSPLLTTT